MNLFEKDSDIKGYLKKGGDINIVNEAGMSLVEYALSEHDNQFNSQFILRLMLHPKLNSRTQAIQEAFSARFIFLDMKDIKPKWQSGFIRSLDLLCRVQDADHDPKKLYPWLNKLVNYSGFEFFHWAYQYHPDFSQGVKLKDTKNELNIWHQFAYLLVANHFSSVDYDKVIEILMDTYPEGLQEKNKFGDTPLEVAHKHQYNFAHEMENGTALTPDAVHFKTQIDNFIKALTAVTNYVELNKKLPVKKSKKSNKKVVKC